VTGNINVVRTARKVPKVVFYTLNPEKTRTGRMIKTLGYSPGREPFGTTFSVILPVSGCFRGSERYANPKGIPYERAETVQKEQKVSRKGCKREQKVRN